DLPPIHKTHPQTTSPETVERIKALALEHPAYGCNRFEARLALEEAHAGKAIEITAEQTAFLEKQNPFFRERHVESGTPGELLSADTFFVGTLKGIGKVYLHAVVDTFGSYAFGFLHVSKQPEVAVLHNDVLPFYRALDLPVKAVLTDNGREFCGTEKHPYELYLDLNAIEHRRTRVRTPKTNGFAERFNGTVLEEVFRVKMRETFYETVEALQADLDAWLVHYNTERPHMGYRNMGRRPIETVMSFVSQEG
ncbi:integrase core domain-containing protein, partial [Rhodovulum sulfidophilum]|uniref:integrase core domain-containing protein n=3 Tax=Rhodovulum sulfidophilum TaxID=35806 RepID=UPI001F5D034C